MKKFQDIEIEVIKFDNVDVICTSGDIDTFDGLYDDDWQEGE